jgi:hypothetical protein
VDVDDADGVAIGVDDDEVWVLSLFEKDHLRSLAATTHGQPTEVDPTSHSLAMLLVQIRRLSQGLQQALVNEMPFQLLLGKLP